MEEILHMPRSSPVVDESSYEEKVDFRLIQHDLTLENFQNLRYLIDGGMSRVLTAELQNVPVVIKMVKPEEVGNQTHLKALETEKRFLMNLSNPYIIKILGSGRDGDCPFIVVEKLISTDIAASLSSKNNTQQKLDEVLTLRTRLGWCLEIALAIKYLHFDALDTNKAIIHRDIKSENIGMGFDGKIRLFDFGIATEYDHSHDYDIEPYEMTRRVGTRNYWAPEVCNSVVYNEKCDVYSFGIVLWEILTGLHPFNTLKDKVLSLLSCTSGPKRRPALRDCWDLDIKQLIEACWDENPTQRPDFQEICSQLNSVISSFEKKRTINSVLKSKFSSLDTRRTMPAK
mmetsp:Transcript_5559/g.7681  ORF Transcript_5559/g.7681 Transcript_5559/m.7681 type:complete len:343 (-) Transcript_5559:239-1267(-)